MTASLNTDATLRVELVECQFTKEARYSISLQLSLPGAAAVQERTEVAASSTQPTFKPSSFEFRLPAGLPLVGSPPVELTLSASTPELDTAAAEGVVPHGVTTAVGEAMLELGDTLRELQQNNGPTAGKPVVRELQLAQAGESTGTLRVRLRLVDVMGQRAPLPAEAETRTQADPHPNPNPSPNPSPSPSPNPTPNAGAARGGDGRVGRAGAQAGAHRPAARRRRQARQRGDAVRAGDHGAARAQQAPGAGAAGAAHAREP